MFGTIRKHQTWLWVVIITLTVISFVIFFSPYSKLNTDEARRGAYGSINGQAVTEEQFIEAQREVYLRYYLMTGRWPDEDARRSGFDPMRETYQWLLILQKQDEMDIHVSPAVAAQAARTMLQPFERLGVTSPSVFVDKVLKQKGMTMADFERYVRHHVGLQELISVVGVSGKLITTDEAKALYIRENQEVASEALVFSLSNHLASVTVMPEAISSMYSNRMESYRIPERIQVTYVPFYVSNYLAAAETELAKSNLNQLVESNVQRLGTNMYRGAKSAEESKANIREDIIRGRALAEARRQAAEFAGPLFEATNPKPEDLEAAAKAKGLPVGVTPMFTREDGPFNMDAAADFARLGFSRTTNEPFAGPIVAENGAYIIAVKNRVPSEVPPLDQVREQVTAEYKEMQARIVAQSTGRSVYSTLTNLMAQGKSFADACKEVNVSPVALPPFSQSTRSLTNLPPGLNLDQLQETAATTPAGKLSPFQVNANGGFILYVKSRLPMDEQKLQKELPNFVTFVRQRWQSEAFNEWFKKEASRGLRNTPVNQQPEPPPDMGAGKTAKS